MTSPNQQDVAALVARLEERWESSASPVTKKINRLLATCREAATALSTLAAERDTWMKQAVSERDMRRWNIDETPDGLVICRGDHDKGEDCEHERWVPAERAEASEARATALEGERDAVNKLISEIGFTGSALACIAYLNEARLVSNDERETVATALEAQLAMAREAMNAGLAYLTGNMDGDWNGEGVPVELLREALRSPAPADGRGDNQMLASASCPQEPSIEGKLVKRPVAFRICAPEVTNFATLYYATEEAAREASDQIGVDYEGLYVRDGTPLNFATPTPDLPTEARADGEFLRLRRGDLVRERDAARDAVRLLIKAIGNDGKTSSLHDWNKMMLDAAAEAEKAIAFDARKERSALTLPPSPAQTGDA